MEEVKRIYNNLSVKTNFILLAALFILVAMFAVEFERTILNDIQREIAFQYSDIVEGFNGEKVWGNETVFLLSENDSRIMQLCEMLIWVLPTITYLVCILAAGALFYKSKLKRPLSLLSASADRIANNDLDFSLHYDKDDEMGALCAAFEKMRSALENSYREMWRQMDERKRLNAAFSHDLRTPLTVLEGHLGVLQKYTPTGELGVAETIETYNVMLGQIERLKNHVFSMNTLQRLDDITISAKSIDAAEFTKFLEDNASIICTEKRLIFQNKVNLLMLNLDTEIVMQVFENFLTNAIRYAASTITVTCKAENSVFSICVEDDGKGFSDNALKSATNPFYTTEKKDDGQHFGLGLNICKILCRVHGGGISLDNRTPCGALVTATFAMQ